MAKITKREVEHVAKLARLKITSADIDIFQKQLSKILGYVDELNEVDTDNLEPTSQTTGLENVFRIDEITNSDSLSQEEAISGTEKTINGYFIVDAILENKDI